MSQYNSGIDKVKNIKLGKTDGELKKANELCNVCTKAMYTSAVKFFNNNPQYQIDTSKIVAAYHNGAGGVRANIEAGKMEMNNNVYDMGSMIHDICVEVTRKIDTKPISFILDIAPDFPHLLKGDSARVNQILDNVLDNAVKFTKSGTIYMGVRWEEKEGRAHIYIDVTDTGTGIKESDLQKIFDAFSQSDMHRNRRAEGTGLGLSIVKKLVDSMDGDIHIVSRENEGTTVKMDIYQGIDDRFPFINVDVEPNTQVFVYEPNR